MGAEGASGGVAATAQGFRRSAARPLQDLLLVVVLPFAYGASTRVPFVFAGVHVLRALRGGLPHVSAALGAYQLSRVVGNALVVTLGPRRSLLVGAASGVAGYLSLALAAGAPPPQLGATHVAWTGLAWFVASLALVGLSEQITALQDLCRQRHAAEPGGARAPLLKLYACNVCGTSAAFLASGVAYSYGGLSAAARVGAAFEAVLLVGAALLLALDSWQPGEGPASTAGADAGAAADGAVEGRGCAAMARCSGGGCGGGGDAADTPFRCAAAFDWGEATVERVPMLSPSATLTSSGSLPAQRLPRSFVGRSLAGVQAGFEAAAAEAAGHCCCAEGDRDAPPLQQVAAAAEGEGQSPAAKAAAAAGDGQHAAAVGGADRPGPEEPSWISYVIALTFCLQALLIGTVLSSAPLIVTQVLRLDVLHVGLAFGAGEAVGSAALVAACTPLGRARLQRALPTPLGLIFVLAVLGASALLLALVRARSVALLLLVAIMALNDVGTSMSGECLGNTLAPRWFLRLNALSNILRRFGNTVTCTTAPLLYSAAPALPFVLFGALTVAWAAMLAALFAQRAQELAAPAGGVDGAGAGKRGGGRGAWSAARHAAHMSPRCIAQQLRSFRARSFVSQERDLLTRLGQLVAPQHGAGGEDRAGTGNLRQRMRHA